MEGHQSVGLVSKNAGELGPTQGLEKRKVPQQEADPGRTETGQWEEYKRDETRDDPQRQSVSQAATRCPAISRSALGPIPVSSSVDFQNNFLTTLSFRSFPLARG